MFSYVQQAICIALSCAALTAAAYGDNHLGIDTTSGNPGDQIVIRAGYYSNETQFTISNDRLLENGLTAVYDISTPLLDSGSSTGWYSEDALTLASDFYFTTGRLNGGSFKFEFSSIVPLSGGSAILAWGDYAEDAQGDTVEPFIPSALSNSATRLGRSFDVGVNEHDDDQGLAFSAPGLYDVTFVAWDSNGRYLDSAPVTARFNVIPASGSAGLLAMAALATGRRRRPLRAGPRSPCPLAARAHGAATESV